MLKGTVFTYIKKIIGEYVHNFSKSQLNLHLFEKKITLKNLILKPEKINQELNKQEFFFNLKAGLINELIVEIPSLLDYKEIIIKIKEVFLIFGPNLSHMEGGTSEGEEEVKKRFQKYCNLMAAHEKDIGKRTQTIKNIFLEKMLLKMQKPASNINLSVNSFLHFLIF